MTENTNLEGRVDEETFETLLRNFGIGLAVDLSLEEVSGVSMHSESQERSFGALDSVCEAKRVSFVTASIANEAKNSLEQSILFLGEAGFLQNVLQQTENQLGVTEARPLITNLETMLKLALLIPRPLALVNHIT